MTTEAGEREKESPEIEEQIECLRSELGDLVQELDRRRHEATDVRLQIRRHPGAVALSLGVVALAVAGRIIFLRRRRRADTLRARAANLLHVLALLSSEKPSEVQRAVEGGSNASLLVPFARAGAAFLGSRLRQPRPTSY